MEKLSESREKLNFSASAWYKLQLPLLEILSPFYSSINGIRDLVVHSHIATRRYNGKTFQPPGIDSSTKFRQTELFLCAQITNVPHFTLKLPPTTTFCTCESNNSMEISFIFQLRRANIGHRYSNGYHQ